MHPSDLGQTQDSLGSFSWAWKFLLLNLFQIVSLLFFAVVVVATLYGPRLISYSTRTVALFAFSAAAFGLLLALPARRWVRIVSVIIPLVAMGSRMFDLAQGGGQLPTYAVWLYLCFVFMWVAPRFMPPPIRNGERRQWLHENGGRAVG